MPSIADSRLMQQVRGLTGCLDTVKALAPHRIYNQKTCREDVAMIAQDAQAKVPELISAGADGYLNLDYDRLGVFLIGAIKELETRVAVLEAAAATPPA